MDGLVTFATVSSGSMIKFFAVEEPGRLFGRLQFNFMVISSGGHKQKCKGGVLGLNLGCTGRVFNIGGISLNIFRGGRSTCCYCGTVNFRSMSRNRVRGCAMVKRR